MLALRDVLRKRFSFLDVSRSTGPLVEVIVAPDLAQRAEIKTHRPSAGVCVPALSASRVAAAHSGQLVAGDEVAAGSPVSHDRHEFLPSRSSAAAVRRFRMITTSPAFPRAFSQVGLNRSI